MAARTLATASTWPVYSYPHTAQISRRRAEYSRQLSSAPLLVDDGGPKSLGTSPNGFPAHLRTFYKTLKLKAFASFLSKLFRRPSIPEREKVAVYEHKGHALLRCTIHIAPVVTSIGLLWLNVSNYYIGGELTGATGEDTQKLAALQVASKLLELLTLSSLATTMLTYVQRELTFGDGLPLGALLAAKEISSINYLWSSRFWGAVMFKNDRGPRKRKKWIFLIPLITVSTILGVFVGPLSATLLIPRVDNWSAGGTVFWVNGTREELFPKRMEDNHSLTHCSVDAGDPSCPYGGWEIINQAYYSFWPRLEPMGSMPENIYMPSPYSHRHLGLRSRSNDSQDGFYESIWTGANSVATVPPSVVADSLAELARLWSFAARNFDPGRRFWSHKDALFTVTVPEPIVQTQCISASNCSSNGSFADLPIPTMNASPDQLETLRLPNQTVATIWSPGRPPELLWLDDPDLKNRTNGTLNAVVSIPNAANGQSLLFTCSIDSAIPDTNISTSRNLVKIVDGNALGYASTNGQFPKIDISSVWAIYLLPQVPNTNTTILTKIVQTAGLYNTPTPSNSYNYQYIIESILSTLLANGLGRASYNSTMLGHLRGYNHSDPWEHNQTTPSAWLSHFLPPGKKYMGFNDDPAQSAFDPLPAGLAAQATMFMMRATVNGYAFSARGSAAKASVSALVIYIVVAFAHIVYSYRAGWASTASDSSLEVAILAAGSRRTGRLKNTGAGTETVSVHEEWVGVRECGWEGESENEQERKRVERGTGRLELVFRDTEVGPRVRRIEKNKAYG